MIGHVVVVVVPPALVGRSRRFLVERMTATFTDGLLSLLDTLVSSAGLPSALGGCTARGGGSSAGLPSSNGGS